MVNIKIFLAAIFLCATCYADIPALKNGELIVVDSVLQNSYKIEYMEPSPEQLNIFKLQIDESIEPSKMDVSWKVEIDQKPIPFIVGMGGDHIGFVYRRGEFLYVSATITSQYNIKEIEYVKNELGTYERIEKDREIYDTASIGERIILDPKPPVPPTPDPDPQPNLTGYAKQAYDGFYRYVINGDKVKLVDSAHRQATSLRTIATKIAAGVIPDVPTLLTEIINGNKQAYRDAGIDPSSWNEFGIFFQNLLWDEYNGGKLQKLSDYQPLLNEMATGLEAVK